MNRVLMISDSNGVRTQIIEGLLIATRKYGGRYNSAPYMDALRDVDERTTPMFMRSCYPVNRLLMEYYRLCNVPYIYYMDDNLWRMKEFRENADLVNTLDELVGNASCVIVNSEVLAEDVRTRNPTVEVLPAFYDFSMLDGVEKEAHPNEIRIGFTSCAGRLPDIEPLVPVIQKLLRAYRGTIAFEFCGVIPNELRDCEGVRYFAPINNYVKFSQFQFSRGWNIGLAPLRPTPANFSKTNNKYREYGACGIAGAYSDAPPYSCARHRHTGLLVDPSEEAWFGALSELIENPDLRRSCGEQARQDVLERFSIPAVLPAWMQAFNAVPYRRVGSFRRIRFSRRSVIQAHVIRVRYPLSNFGRHVRRIGMKRTLIKAAKRLHDSISGLLGS